MTRPAVILVRPQEEGNIGAVARAMANMGLERLILVEPAPRIGGVARGFGVGGWEILDQAVRVSSFTEAVEPFGRLVGSTSRRERPMRRRRIVSPRQLPEILAADPAGTPTALVFGSEASGLRRAELDRCSPIVAVPCSAEHPTLNLAQAVLILAYELHLASPVASPAEAPPDADALAPVGEIDGLEEQIDAILLTLGYDHPPIHQGLLRDLRRLLIHASPSRREVRILRRLCNRTASALAEPRQAGPRQADPE